jgi:hypothetical protein
MSKSNIFDSEAQNMPVEDMQQWLENYYSDLLPEAEMSRVEHYLRTSEEWREQSRDILINQLAAQDSLWTPLSKEELDPISRNLSAFVEASAAHIYSEETWNTDTIWQNHIDWCEQRILFLDELKRFTIAASIAISTWRKQFSKYRTLSKKIRRIEALSEGSWETLSEGNTYEISAGETLSLQIPLADSQYVAVIRMVSDEIAYAIPIQSEKIIPRQKGTIGNWTLKRTSDGKATLDWTKTLPPIGIQSIWLIIANDPQSLDSLINRLQNLPFADEEQDDNQFTMSPNAPQHLEILIQVTATTSPHNLQ